MTTEEESCVVTDVKNDILPLGVYMPCCMEPPGSNTGALKSATAESISSKLQLPGPMPLLGLGYSGIYVNNFKEKCSFLK